MLSVLWGLSAYQPSSQSLLMLSFCKLYREGLFNLFKPQLWHILWSIPTRCCFTITYMSYISSSLFVFSYYDCLIYLYAFSPYFTKKGFVSWALYRGKFIAFCLRREQAIDRTEKFWLLAMISYSSHRDCFLKVLFATVAYTVYYSTCIFPLPFPMMIVSKKIHSSVTLWKWRTSLDAYCVLNSGHMHIFADLLMTNALFSH